MKKYFLFCILLFLMFLCGCADENQKFDTFTDSVFEEALTGNTLNLHFLISDTSDIAPYKVSLGDFSDDSFKCTSALLKSKIKVLNSFKYNNLSKDRQFTYKILLTQYKDELKYCDYYYLNEFLNFSGGWQNTLPAYLLEFKFRSKRDIDDYLKTLKISEDFFNSLLDFEKKKSSLGLFMNNFQADKTIAECRSFIKDADRHYLITSFNRKINSAVFLSDREKRAYTRVNVKYLNSYFFPSYEKIADTLETLKSTAKNFGGLCHYPGGKNFYEGLIRSNTGSDKSVAEIEDMLEDSLADDFVKISMIVKSGFNADVPKKYSHTSDILPNLYVDIQNFFPEPAIGVDSYRLETVPKSAQNHEAPAYYMIPPIDLINDNVIYINKKYYPVDDTPRLIPVLAHEGFPGHMYQTTYFRSMNPSKIRFLLNFPGYTEGYGTYAEIMSFYIAGFDKKCADYLAANTLFSLELYSLFDIYVNYEGKSFNEILKIGTGFGMDTDSVLDVYQYVIDNPCNYLRYSVGYHEILELKSEYKNMFKNDFSLMHFHEFLLKKGPAQFELIRQTMQDG